MPIGSVHVDAPLSNISLAYKNADNIMREVFPPFPSNNKSNLIYKQGKELFLAEDDARAAGAEANEGTPNQYSTLSFACGGHALREKCPRDTQNNSDPAIDLMRDSTITKTAQSSLNEEVAGVAKLVAVQTGSYVSDQAATPWDSPNFDPYKFLRQKLDTINLASGCKPNQFAVSGPVWTAIRTNPNVVGLITGAPSVPNARITLEQFAELLELDKVVVGRAVYTTTLNGTMKWVWGEKSLLYYKPAAPGLRTLALGYTPVWVNALASVTGLTKIPGMDGQGDQFVQQYFWEPELSDYVVVHRYYDQMSVAPECGILFTGCLGTANA